MTDDQLTAPERALIQWLSDEVGLSKEREAEMARRLVAMRAQQPAGAPPSEAEIEAWRTASEKTMTALEGAAWVMDGVRLMRRAAAAQVTLTADEPWFIRARSMSHTIDLLVRYDGRDYRFCADWLKGWTPPTKETK